ncbi:MAG: CPBP family intramembrane metalloprotease, partial [Anaerolineae bacterium]
MAYEAVYLLFFITIEFSFRGYLLFGLNSILNTFVPPSGQPIKTPRFGLYAILIQMLAYTVWHHGKPVPELVGALVWGVCAAAIALRIRSIWPIIIAHWLYNVLLDTLLWGVFPLFGLA